MYGILFEIIIRSNTGDLENGYTKDLKD